MIEKTWKPWRRMMGYDRWATRAEAPNNVGIVFDPEPNDPNTYEETPVKPVKIMAIDPEWSVWSWCAEDGCRTVLHACCEEHLRNDLDDHYTTDHS